MPEYRALAALFSRLHGANRSDLTAEQALCAVTGAAVEAIDGAEEAAVTRGRRGRFETTAATSDLPLRVDSIQYELGLGPCVDAVLKRSVFRCDDLRTDERWPQFGRRAAEETGVLSMLSFRMFFEEDNLIAGLNLYAGKPKAFDDEAETIGLVMATHGALALTSAVRLERIEHLERALASNRDIGVAIGILMARHLVTKQQAFDLLRVASQHTHRKIGAIALDVADTGELEFPRPSPQGAEPQEPA
jgi:hypothetical protein